MNASLMLCGYEVAAYGIGSDNRMKVEFVDGYVDDLGDCIDREVDDAKERSCDPAEAQS